jgi:hypothetical protein
MKLASGVGILCTFFLAVSVQAACPESDFSVGNLSENRFGSEVDSTSCNVQLKPLHARDAYRSYNLSSRGTLEIDDTVSTSNTASGQQVYFFFPRTGFPSAKQTLSGDVIVTTASGDTVMMDPGETQAPRLQSSPTTTIQATENPTIRQGAPGVKLSLAASSHSLLLDTGYQFGKKPAFMNPEGTSTFHDASGHSCPLKNGTLFTYTRWDASIKFTDSNLVTFLKANCPDLDTSGLLRAHRQDCASCNIQ